jgi:hypothetical protein
MLQFRPLIFGPTLPDADSVGTPERLLDRWRLVYIGGEVLGFLVL